MVNVLPAISKYNRLSNHLVLIEDDASGLRGAIAIDSTVLGPAAGGCRFWRYDSISDLHADALRLSRGMTYKNAMAGLPFGGGKAVIQMPNGPFDRTKLFEAFGRAVQELEGMYITAEDVGTCVNDMQAIRGSTAFVAGLESQVGKAGGDPSPWTALGVFQSLQVAARAALGAELSDLRVAVQGAGNVGGRLVERLAEAGARVLVTDVDPARCAELAHLNGVEVVSPESITGAQVDVYAPCALGGALDEVTIDRLKARVVCGGANNQLATDDAMTWLHQRGITYVPDYVANAGGIINVAAEYLGETTAEVESRVERIAPRVEAILARARAEDRSPAIVADEMAREILHRAGGGRA